MLVELKRQKSVGGEKRAKAVVAAWPRVDTAFGQLARGTKASDWGASSRRRRAARRFVGCTTPKRAPTRATRCPLRRRGTSRSRRPGLGIMFVASRGVVSRRDLVSFIWVPTMVQVTPKPRLGGKACRSPSLVGRDVRSRRKVLSCNAEETRARHGSSAAAHSELIASALGNEVDAICWVSASG